MTGDRAGRDAGSKREQAGHPQRSTPSPTHSTRQLYKLLNSFESDTLPVNLPNSSSISSLPLDLGMLPTKSRRFGTLILILRVFPALISWLSSCGKNNKGTILKRGVETVPFGRAWPRGQAGPDAPELMTVRANHDELTEFG